MSETERTAGTRPRSFRGGGVVLVLLVAGLATWIGLRVKAATGKQQAVASERRDVARAASEVASRPPVVAVVRGEPAAVETEIRLEGTLAPVREADLGFKTGGRIAAIRVKVGDRVRAGAVLATLDAREAGAQVAAAAAQVAAAEAQLGLAADAAQRTAAVVTAGAQPEAAGVQARQQKALAEAQLEAARAQLALARTAQANHTLAAPFAGTVSRVPPGPGAVVAPGAAQFHVADYGTLKLVGTVAAADARLVKPGAIVVVRGGGGGAGATARGKVVAVVAALDAVTKRVPVEAEIDNDGKDPLLAGTLVQASVGTARPTAVLRLPPTALRPGSQDELLVVKGDRLELRQVELAVAADGALMVRRGLDAGDVVLARPWPEAKAGDRVTVAAAEPAATAAAGARGGRP